MRHRFSINEVKKRLPQNKPFYVMLSTIVLMMPDLKKKSSHGSDQLACLEAIYSWSTLFSNQIENTRFFRNAAG